MKIRNKIAFGINLVPVVAGALLGLQYWLAPSITAYHKQVIGVPWESLAPGVQLMLMILMKSTGHATLLAAVSIFILMWIPFRQGQNWSRGAILIIGLVLYVPYGLGAAYLRITTGASSPWWANLLVVLLMIAAFLISGDMKKKE